MNFFTKNPNLKKKKCFFFLFVGREGVGVAGEGGARVNDFFLLRIQILNKKNGGWGWGWGDGGARLVGGGGLSK